MVLALFNIFEYFLKGGAKQTCRYEKHVHSKARKYAEYRQKRNFVNKPAKFVNNKIARK